MKNLKNDCVSKIQRKENLVKAAKKYQMNEGEDFKQKNLQSVKKYQDNVGDKFKKNNLNSVKKYQDKSGELYKASHIVSNRTHYQKVQSAFPPTQLTTELQHKIISGACQDMSSTNISESGCAVCGRLTQMKNLKKLSTSKLDLSILCRSNISSKERYTIEDPVQCLEGPVIVNSLDNICQSCYNGVSKGKVPLMALVNGMWIGDIPQELSALNFVEQLLVARVRHNRCIVKVSSGMHKMRANAITFENPTPKVYDILPPPVKDLDEVLAFIYTGPCKPTQEDFQRTPLLVRHDKVSAALEWLKLNHSDYYDLEISYRNLEEYPDDSPPVVVDYRESFSNKDPESAAVNDNY